MIEFRKISIKDKEFADRCFATGNTDGSSYSFGTLFCWGDSYSLEIAEFDSMLLIRGRDHRGRYYAYPSGTGDIKAAIEAMAELSRSEGEVFRLVQILGNNKSELEELFPDRFLFTYNRDFSEYVYSVKNMAELPGKRFHGKKGHLNAFFRKHTDVACDPITKDNIHLCLEIARSWLSDKDSSFELDAEQTAIGKAIENYDALAYEGAILFADGKAVAFTMGEKLKNNTFCTHFEKTLPDYRDAYPVINNGFTKLMLMTYDYVNREEDMGQEGLRKAKLSYQPEFLVDKFNAVEKNDPCRKYRADEADIPELKALWKAVFGDGDKTTDFFFENTVSINDVYAYKKDSKVVSAFYLIDTVLKRGNEELRAKYLYAAATLPEYRKLGIMSEMIDYALQFSRLSGYDAVFLYPADDKLYDYYARHGFKEKFACRIYEADSVALEGFRNQRYFSTVLSYPRMRQFVAAENYADFGVEYLDFARHCAEYGGFEISAVFDDEDKVFIIGHTDNDVMYVDEAFSSEFNIHHILGVLADKNIKKIILKVPEELVISGFSSAKKRDGMMYMFADDDKTYYLGQPCM